MWTLIVHLNNSRKNGSFSGSKRRDSTPQPKIIREDLIDKGEIIFFLLFEFWLIKPLKIVRHVF